MLGLFNDNVDIKNFIFYMREELKFGKNNFIVILYFLYKILREYFLCFYFCYN